MHRPLHRPMHHRPLMGLRRSFLWPMWGMGRFNLFLWMLLPGLMILGVVFWRVAFSLAL